MDINTAILEKPISPSELEKFCISLMRQVGLSEEDAKLSAEVLVKTDTWGIHTHGTKQLRFLMRNFKARRLLTEAKPEVVSEGASWALVDGHYAMPMVSSVMAMELAIAKAKETGSAVVGVRHSSHFGAAGYYANMAAEADMIGFSMCNVEPYMTVPGAKGRVLGTNPIAYAVPAGEEPPIFFDVATSAVAVSKIFAARALGKEIPPTWMVDANGDPTTDPTKVDEGALLPMAAHKGYGFALLAEILSAVLTGSAMLDEVQSWVLDVKEPSNQGHAFMVINPGLFMPIDAFKARMDELIRKIKSSPRRREDTPIYLPGEMEWNRRQQALQSGIKLPEDVVASLKGLVEDLKSEGNS